MPRMEDRNPTIKERATPNKTLKCAVSTEKLTEETLAFFDLDLLYMRIAKMHSAAPKISEKLLPVK